MMLPVATQRDIHIIPEPTAEAHVPATPELCDAGGQIGIIEILQEPETQNPAQADGHVGITGEVKINLQAESKGIYPGEGHGFLTGVPVDFRQQAQLVGQEHLFAQAQQKPADAMGRIFPGGLPVIQLRGDVRIPDDGAGDELGEHGNVGTEGNQAPLGRHRTPVHIHAIAHALEEVKADADRQGQGNEAAGEKSGILKDHQQTHAGSHRQGQPEFLPLAVPDSQTVAIEGQNGSHHQNQIFWFPPAVKNQAGDQEQTVPPALGHHEISQEHQGQKII